MLRAIIKKKSYHECNGFTQEGFETIDFDCPELESVLRGVGYGECGYDSVHLVGVEVLIHKQGIKDEQN
jgi:hypothetical protein